MKENEGNATKGKEEKERKWEKEVGRGRFKEIQTQSEERGVQPGQLRK